MNELYPLALPKGTVLAGQYIIEEALGQGGFGITYKAKDHKTGQDVAVKEFFPDTLATRTSSITVTAYTGDRGDSFAYGLKCFLVEAQTLAEFIGNDNIINIHSYFEENGTAYFVMDFVEGISFDKYIKSKGGRIPYEEAEGILMHVIDALADVHSKGVIHRDVTPDNIYLTNDNKVMLLDFGAARYSLGDKSRSLDVVLKHGFAPKEQYTRRGKQGPFTDVYSLGASFYFAITGKRPPDSIDRIDDDELIMPSSLGVAISEEKENALLKALSVQPGERFQSMIDFKNALLGIDVVDNSWQNGRTEIIGEYNYDPNNNQMNYSMPGYGQGQGGQMAGFSPEPVAPMPVPNYENGASYGNEKPKKKKGKGGLIALIAIMIVLAIGGCATFFLVPNLFGGKNKSVDDKASRDDDDDEDYDEDEDEEEASADDDIYDYETGSYDNVAITGESSAKTTIKLDKNLSDSTRAEKALLANNSNSYANSIVESGSYALHMLNYGFIFKDEDGSSYEFASKSLGVNSLNIVGSDIYVTDDSGATKKYDKSTASLEKFGGFENTTDVVRLVMYESDCVAVFDDGNDKYTMLVGRVGSDGRWTNYSSLFEVNGPSGIACDGENVFYISKDGRTIEVTNLYSSEGNNTGRVYNASSGTKIKYLAADKGALYFAGTAGDDNVIGKVDIAKGTVDIKTYEADSNFKLANINAYGGVLYILESDPNAYVSRLYYYNFAGGKSMNIVFVTDKDRKCNMDRLGFVPGDAFVIDGKSKSGDIEVVVPVKKGEINYFEN